MNENYASASEIVRRLDDLKCKFELLLTEGRFRVVKLAPPFYDGSEIWVVNDRGFLWEPAASVDAAIDYLASDEALAYNAESV